MSELVLGVSEFVAYVNQTLETAYPYLDVVGEVSSYRVSKGKWVYFDLKDEAAIVRCFTTVYALSGPLEDGMMVRVAGSPRLHPLFNFSFNVQTITAVGEGSLRRQADILFKKLEVEGLFAPERKRPLPKAPRHIALIAAGQSAAYADFIKIAKARWGGLVIDHYDVLVQGEQAPGEIIKALQSVEAQPDLAETVVLVRGGGSIEDLAAFSDERVVRAVAASRVPTLVAIGHEVDTALAELAADLRASTPSNAAELLLPDKVSELGRLHNLHREIDGLLMKSIEHKKQILSSYGLSLDNVLSSVMKSAWESLKSADRLLQAYDPHRPLSQGYALVRRAGDIVRSVEHLKPGDIIEVELTDGKVSSQVKTVHKKGRNNDK